VRGAGSSAKLPDADTVWRQEGTGPLTQAHPIALSYDNGEGLTFRAPSRSTTNICSPRATRSPTRRRAGHAVPYALISRHGTPHTEGYYILHEGLIGVMGDQGLQEQTYKNIEEKKAVAFKATNAWLGFTDKYWAAALLPDTNASVAARYSAGAAGLTKTYQTDYLLDAQTIAPGATGAANMRLFAGAKEVQTIDAYDKALGPQPLRAADRLGLVLLHHQADVQSDRLFLPLDRQFRARDPDRHRDRQAPVLPARQQVLRLDGQDEGGAARRWRRSASATATTR
jgi:YidC/Oxa1 family membrane protein insertase